ncbi:hypothetical protein IFM89_031299 [Coptis chinensis]|uniref:ZF-HD dimerization-type domain-containing protein n=1 Tax=Coptis chinensis TaxID=261450 RepID=A0A835J0T2_9MAGN|nr:hypothetical protein IFM89_031299 [Coptis chinensis]
MDLKTSNNTTTTTTTTTTPETETETPPATKHLSKILSFTNGAFKPHQPHFPPPPIVVLYKECLKNHAATLGGHALDGCGEFMPSPTSIPTDPTSLKCAACGCHRNFHRRDPEEQAGTTHMIEYHPIQQQQQPTQIPTHRARSPTSSVSPPPISSSYYPSSAPHMLLALSTAGLSAKPENTVISPIGGGGSNGTGSGRKRFRTKFSTEQKEKMHSFSEKLGWKMQKRDEGIVEEFCNEIGVGKGVLKVWMHNNKHTVGKRDGNNGISASDANLLLHNNNTISSNNSMINNHNGNSVHVVGTNCSSSS